ncbi:DUF421 domain-containing protein [Snodgrassella sp. ESL0253]|uniref:DUF421 domain-containing protein n=1 Tax=Snodgrassella sp. ESL0253 TaxID=2705031 RepID=UPI00158410A7|nr:YetF domain-containing protein [Snodgrassella sp. ESL0253]NUE66115.1 DUF421 domain-containing protein [Snodgrassella sp. ESL0253]
MNPIYINIICKMLVAFCILLVYINLSGKGSLAPISAIDQVGNVVLGAIIGGPLYNPSISIILLMSASIFWAGLLLLVRYATFKRNIAKDFVDGTSIRLMENGIVLSQNFRKAKLSIRDFIMLLHQRGYPSLEVLSDVWFEYNGQMTVVKKGDPAMAVVVIENGVINYPSLEALGHDEEWLDKELNRQGQKLEEVFLAEVHEQKLWVYPDVKKAS